MCATEGRLNGCRIAVLGWLLAVVAALAQSPDALVQGVVSDSSGKPLAGARVTATHLETGTTRDAFTDAAGRYLIRSLPRGPYNIKAEKDGYGAALQQSMELPVGAQLELPFTLPASSASGAQRQVDKLLEVLPPAPTLPVETVASSVSVVVDETKILQLPLASRNIYSLFLLQPGVTSPGAIPRRGLTFALNGQRVSGSNYLLDGVDNNNTVLTGPVAATSAEAIQEFRMVNSSFSAENGRATSFVAQVVTRAGGNKFHGGLFEFLANDKLNANTFENNSSGTDKPALRQNQFGYSASGPIARNRTFFSSVLELSRLRFSTERDDMVPSSFFIAGLPENALARRLLSEVPPVASEPTARDRNIGLASYQVSSRVDTTLATHRVDHHFANGRDRLTLRYALASTEETEPTRGYPSLRATDRYRGHNGLLAWTHSFEGGAIQDLRLGWSRERIRFPRPRSDLPNLRLLTAAVFLPGSIRQLDQGENNNVVQISDTFSMRRGRSAFTTGFDYRRNLSNSRTLGLQKDALGGEGLFFDGAYFFPDLSAFARGQPFQAALSVDRFSSGNLRLPDMRRQYRSNEYAAFFQDDLKLTRRFSLNLGLRYEYFGVPHNSDRSQDVNFYFGSGSTIEERLASGNLRRTDQNPGDLQGLLYRRDRWNWAPSIGLAWDPFGRGRTVLRAGYALALDRVFDTVRDLRENSQQVVTCNPPACSPRFLVPAAGLLALLPQSLLPGTVVHLDETLRTPYAQNWFIGFQHTLTESFLVEIGHAGSVGRKLISRDLVNRGAPAVRLNPWVTLDTFLSNAGNSNFLALEAALRRRFSRGLQYQFSYTYSHAIDNQSDILEGVRTGAGRTPALAVFTRQFDARIDRGNANFDQRHNLIFNAIWDLPAPPFRRRWPGRLLRDWATSMIGGYQSGFPVTVIGSSSALGASLLRNNRVDFAGDATLGARPGSAAEVAGGVQWLDRGVFRAAPADQVGTLGRGAFRGPAFWNYDFALLRNFGRRDGPLYAQFRAEFYNLFNHANLSAPVSVLDRADFGHAYYGINRTYSRFGELPLDNPSRKIQFGVRIHF